MVYPTAGLGLGACQAIVIVVRIRRPERYVSVSV
jgi:hypothetical protein